MTTTDRAVSTVVSYGLVLGIVALITAALFVSLGDFTQDQREGTARETLRVVGAGFASDLETASRLAMRSGESGSVVLTARLPSRVAGSLYEIHIADAGGVGRYEITLRGVNPDVSTTVHARTSVPVEPGTVDGGAVEITYDAGQSTVTVDDA